MYRIIGAKMALTPAYSASSADWPAGTRRANIARVYGYWPGGSRDFLADQDLGLTFS
jgi:hypothetical protein